MMAKRVVKSQVQQKQVRVYYGYCRVSTDEQAESGYGLEAQQRKVRAYAEAMGYELAEVIVDDGYSGSTLARPGLTALLERIHNGEVAGVIIAKLDRLSRSAKNLLVVYDDAFKATSTALISVAETFDTSTHAGYLFFGMLGQFAEFERGVITERMSGGRKVKAGKGGYAGGGAPIGYTSARGSKALAVDEEKAATVQRTFALAAEGKSHRQVAAALNAEGHTTAKGAGFTHVQVSRILERKALYAGGYQYGGIVTDEGQQAPII